MATSFGKIALGVGCGVLLAGAIAAGSCVACTGAVMKIGQEASAAAKVSPVLQDGWKLTDTSVSGSVTNPNDYEIRNVRIGFDLKDAASGKISLTRATTASLGAHATWNFSAPVHDPRVAKASLAYLDFDKP